MQGEIEFGGAVSLPPLLISVSGDFCDLREVLETEHDLNSGEGSSRVTLVRLRPFSRRYLCDGCEHDRAPG